jgi:tetratricopeptide (TPR) repeat protein
MNPPSEPVLQPSLRRVKKKKSVEPIDQEDEDPVMALFEARSTQRVRFSSGGPEIKEIIVTEDAAESFVESADKPCVEKEDAESPTGASGAAFIQKFMRMALFGGKSTSDEAEVQQEIDNVMQQKELVWESATSPTSAPADFVRTRSGRLAMSFTEDPLVRAKVMKFLNKARRAQFVHYRYEYAVKCHVKAMDYLKRAHYPDDHPVVVKAADALTHSHHALSSLRNSASIVKMGIKHEDTGDLVRALKQYTIAFRIRRDNLSRSHPSLVVLLNMLGSIQIKRGELEEAMQIYQLALKDEIAYENDATAASSALSQDEVRPGSTNLLARSVSYRELGTIYERRGEGRQALKMYERSLECLAEFKVEQIHGPSLLSPSSSTLATLTSTNSSPATTGRPDSPTAVDLDAEIDDGLDTASMTPHQAKPSTASGGDNGMEVLIQELAEHNKAAGGVSPLGASPPKTSGDDYPRPEDFCLPTTHNYATFFPTQLDEAIQNKKRRRRSQPSSKKSRQEKQADHANIDVALTLHQIAQLHRAQGDFHKALSAYEISLRGMKYCLGRNHPNVAAILGNMGNLQKEMGDLDAAFDTYQQVLGIESYRLGLSHPDVAITLHNIATIDAARGKHDHALALYGQVVNLQRKLFGPDHASVAVTAACMADVYDKTGDMKQAVEWYEEAARIKTVVMGRHSLEVARLLHKLGKLAIARLEYHLADSLVSRAVLIYRLNKLPDDDEWMVDACRDNADAEAAIATGKGVTFEC